LRFNGDTMAETNEKVINHKCGCVHKIGKNYINLEPCPKHKEAMAEFAELLKGIGHGYDNDVL
jgi:hypothetical protein